MNIDFSIIDYLESRGVTGYHLENLNETSEAKLLVDNNGKFQSIINNDFNENKEVLKKKLYIVK